MSICKITLSKIKLGTQTTQSISKIFEQSLLSKNLIDDDFIGKYACASSLLHFMGKLILDAGSGALIVLVKGNKRDGCHTFEVQFVRPEIGR